MLEHAKCLRALTPQSRDRYKNNCLKLNEYTAEARLHQGNGVEKYQNKIEKVRVNMKNDEADLRGFLDTYESTNQKWENEWRTFLDVSEPMGPVS